MVVGSGLLAGVFLRRFEATENVCVYAAGVSNSSCVDAGEFAREKDRLSTTLKELQPECMLVYFSTCSIYDPDRAQTLYVKHKLAMERLVSESNNFLIVRLPQAVGRSANPHTLLNSLYNKIRAGAQVKVWTGAKRNLLDIDDIERICAAIIDQGTGQNRVLNVANPRNYRVGEIIESFERVLGVKASTVEEKKGGAYEVDIAGIAEILRTLSLGFNDAYLDNLVRKYYG
ncbi:NAD-dependent epimerase/dehydratase family protein [Actomonas aquatica]|uniref:NAD-dependent epimerase/dehydratase family protein n=1 Tax=Actomonas aquatica TaxID=2866162 RepID=A0ABZ1CB03_9BACT|nr:NAD-dependent epimerase/dehydratase family protein [Opitutus sp. WL0086]WRQ88492.1 NAD-dependent epimerase/dehydratase family protein [Opitutus sp. WL0086]